MIPIWMLMIEASKASKEHRCTWCGQAISKGEHYAHWMSIDAVDPVVNKMHKECLELSGDHAQGDVDFEYRFFKNERPQV